MPACSIVSLIQPGDTLLRRNWRGMSSAAARMNPSRPAPAMVSALVPGMGWVASCPVVSVIDPASRRPHDRVDPIDLIEERRDGRDIVDVDGWVAAARRAGDFMA